MDSQRQSAIRRVAHALVEAIQYDRAASVFIRCEDSRATDEALEALRAASRRVQWVDVRLDAPVDPFPELVARAQGDRTIFLCTHISDHAMRRLHLEVERFTAMRIRCVFLLPAGQVTLFGRVGRNFWERRSLYIAWPERRAVGHEGSEHQPTPPDSVPLSNPIRRRIEAALSIPDPRARGHSVLVACRDAYHAGDVKLAGEFILGALRDLRDHGADDEHAEALQLVGALAEARGDFKAAQDWYLEARKHWESCENPLGLANVYTRLGSLGFARGDLTEAGRYLEKALEYEESLGSPARQADAHRFVGMLRERQGLLSDAERHLRKSLELAEATGEQGRISRALHQLGHLSEKQDNLEGARDLYTRALRIRESERDFRGMAASFHQLGNIHYQRAEVSEALKYYQQAVELEIRIGDEQGLAATLLQLAHVSEERFQLAPAYRHLTQARPILRRLNSPLLPEAEARLERLRALLSPEELQRLESPPRTTSSGAAPAPQGDRVPSRAPVAARRASSSAPAAERATSGGATDEDLRGFRELLGGDSHPPNK